MRTRLAVLLGGVLLLFAFPRPAVAQWENLGGPGTCAINSIATMGTYVFAGTEFGIFVSPDEGMTWSKAGATGPAALGHAAVNGFLASGAELFAYSAGGIHVSTDYGASWTPVNAGLPELRLVTCMLAKDDVLFCGLFDGEVYRSADRGGHWLPAGFGLPKDSQISSLTARGQDLFAAYRYGEGIYQSRDDGATWMPVAPALPCESSVCFLAAAGPRLFVGTCWDGIYVLDEDRPAWTKIRAIWDEDGDVSFLEAVGTSVLACVDEAAYHSADGGSTWKKLGFKADSDELSVACIAATGPRLFLGTEGAGLFRSGDLGLSWVPINAGFPSQAEICDLAWVGKDLFAGIREWGPSEEGRTGDYSWRHSGRGIVFAKTEGGSGWEPVRPPLPPAIYLYCLVAVGSNLLAGSDAGLFFSDDRGRTWKPVWPERPYPPTVHRLVVMDGRVFAGTDDGIYLSTDQGRSWLNVFGGEPRRLEILCFAQLGSALFAGGDDGVFVSRDRGKNWEPAGELVPDYATCTDLAASGKLLVAGVYPREERIGPDIDDEDVFFPAGYPKFAILISTDEGRSWKAVTEGLPEDFRVSCLAASGSSLIAALEGHYLKAGRHCRGIYLSTDGGASWTEDWPGRWLAAPVNRFLTDKTDIYIATEGAGIWKLPLSALKKGS